MKKVIIVLAILVLAFCTVFFATDLFKPERILEGAEASKLASEAYLDILINIKEYPNGKNVDAKLLEAAMRIARELELIKDEDTPYYREYVPKETVHLIIEELTGKPVKEPIKVEDFDYLYDEEKDYYYIVPVGTDWIRYNEIKNVLEKGHYYEVICDADLTDYDGIPITSYENMVIKLKKVSDNRYIRYRIESISAGNSIEAENK